MVILIGFFPSPLPDELLYSTLARFHLLSGSLSGKATSEELFDGSFYKATISLPTHLLRISELMKGTCSPDTLINNHTLFPYYAAFLQEDRAKLIRQVMFGDTVENVYAQLGLLATSVKMPSNLRACLQCLNEDEEQYGIPYWHRSHQVPGVFVCHKHGCILKESQVACYGRRNQFAYIHLDRDVLSRDIIQIDGPILKEHLKALAMDSYMLLNQVPKPSGVRSLNRFYRQMLHEQKLISNEGYIRFKALHVRFQNDLGKDLLILCNSEIQIKSKNTWLHKLIRGEPFVHTLRHLLLLRYLRESISTIFHVKQGNIPLGKDPWPEQSDENRIKIGQIKEIGFVSEDNCDDIINRPDLPFRLNGDLLGVDNTKIWVRRWPKMDKNSRDIDAQKEPTIKKNEISNDLNNVMRQALDNQRLNWEQRDKEMLPQIVSAIQEIRINNKRPIRVTLPEIRRRLYKRPMLEKMLDKMPQCQQLIRREIESIKDYQIRRVELAAKKLHETEGEVVRWKVIRIAELRKESALKIIEEIERVIGCYV